MDASPAMPRATAREWFAWSLYDWANSAYSTLSITILNGYLLHVVFPTETWGRTGDIVWAWGIGGSMFMAGLASPICGAWADARANKRGWLAATALGGAGLSIVLGCVAPEQPWLVTPLFLLVSFCFELSLAFYNGFLPELADEQEMNRLSAQGFAWGYVGGGMALLAALGLIQWGESLGLPTIADRLRASLVLMGIWWGLFSLPTILVLRDRAVPVGDDRPIVESAAAAFRSVGHTLRQVRALPCLALFLLGFLFYNDAVQTVISQASTFATRELSFSTGELSLVILMIQFLAFPGALCVGWLADRWGTLRALHACLAAWGVLLAGAYFVHEKWQFWCLGGVVALILGGIQAVSRSVMGTLTPPNRAAEFFGFFNLSGKTTSFMGTFLFGLIVWWTHSARLAIVSLLVLLLAGWLIIGRVDLRLGRAQALDQGK